MAVKKYLKIDSEKGYLDNKDDINYYATNQMRRVAFGSMLGDFDENGLYVINQKVVDELIKMPKVIVDMVEGSDLIRSKVKFDGFYHFILTVEENKATFSLLEKLQYQSNRDFNSGAYSDINEYVLDEMKVPDKDFNRNSLYEKYNISVTDDGDALSIFDMDELSLALYYNIIEKIKINYLIENELILKEKEIESVEADYFEAMLEALSAFPEFETKVRNEMKNNLAEKHNFVIINKPFFQKTINEVLDSCVEQYVEDLSPEHREEFLKKAREAKSNYYTKFKQVVPIEIKQSAGVRFNPEQIQEETIIGSLAQEITTKGYTSSDVRRVAIKDDDLKMTLEKIKSIVEENKKLCMNNNANATHITKGRVLTTKFYKEFEAEQKIAITKPEKTLLGEAVSKNEQNATKTSATVATKATANTVKSPVKTATKSQSNSQGRSAGNSNKSGKGGATVKKEPPKPTKTNTTAKTSNNSASTRLWGIGSGLSDSTQKDEKVKKHEQVEELDELDEVDRGLLNNMKGKDVVQPAYSTDELVK